MFEEYLVNNHNNDLINILKDEDTEKHFSIIVNFANLFENCPELGNNLLEEPTKTLKKFEKRGIKAQRKLLEQNSSFTEKCFVHVRITGLPTCPELNRIVIPTREDLGSFLQISGTVVRITASKMLEYKRHYRCCKCKHIITIEADYEQRFIFQTPKICSIGECFGKNILPIKNLEQGSCKDYQEIKLQEQLSKLGVGSMPSSIWVTLEDDLVDCCKPGDDVTICGTVLRRWKPQCPGKKLDIELVIKANHVEVNNDQRSIMLITPEIKTQFKEFWEQYKDNPLNGRDIILRSFCPELYGLYIVKLAVSVILAGGLATSKSTNSGVRIRSEPHLLLVGDPGTGKSQLLKFAAKIIPRSVLTTGIGCTSAGLTVTAVMEDGEWQLEAGALVLSDEGICCIDEFNSMKEHDRASIHEAMEQQTISVAKASMVCKLSTRCSVLAATNPKGHIDSNQSLSLNVAMASPLLSRFDLVLMLKDSLDQKWDEVVCDYILNGQISDDKNENWNTELIQAYFTVIKGLQPILTEDANAVLSSYYQAQRQAPTRNLARTTVRLLDSLVRLSQAHAKLMFRSEVLTMDAIMAVALVESSMQGAALLLPVDIDTLHAPFPKNPMKSYIELMSTILEKLTLYDILNAELDKHKSISNNDQGNKNNINEKRSHAENNINENNQNKASNNKHDDLNEAKRYINDENNIKSAEETIELQKKSSKLLLFGNSKKPGPSKFMESKNIVVETSISQIEEVLKESNKRKYNFNTIKKKSKILKTDKKENMVTDATKLLNLVPSVNDILDNIDLDMPSSLILEENETEFRSSTQKQRECQTKIIELHNKFEFKPKQSIDIKKISATSSVNNINLEYSENEISKNDVPKKVLIEDSFTQNIIDINLNAKVMNKENNAESKTKVRHSLTTFAFRKTEPETNVEQNVESETELSQSSSQLSSKNLFQSQDDDFDLDFNL